MNDKLAAAVLALQASAAPDQCMPRDLAGQMAVAVVPSLIESAAQHCGPHLPAGAFLGSGSRALSERIAAETATLRPAAVAVVLAMTGQDAPAPGQDTDQMIAVLTGNIAASLDPAQCRGASELLQALAPLPTPNIGQAFAAVLGVAVAGSGDDGPPICRE